MKLLEPTENYPETTARRLEVDHVAHDVVLVLYAVAAEHVAARARDLERLSGVG